MKLGLKDRSFKVNYSKVQTMTTRSVWATLCFNDFLKVLQLRSNEESKFARTSFEELDRSLKSIGLEKDSQSYVYEAVATILHLCNLEFIENASQETEVSKNSSSYESLDIAAKFLNTKSKCLMDALTKQDIKAGSSYISYVIRFNS